MLLWDGLERGLLVRKLLPACSATLVARERVVEPTYSDVHRTQLNLYIRELRMPTGILSLYENKLPILKLLVRMN